MLLFFMTCDIIIQLLLLYCDSEAYKTSDISIGIYLHFQCKYSLICCNENFPISWICFLTHVVILCHHLIFPHL